MVVVTDALTDLLVPSDPDSVYVVLIEDRHGGPDVQVFRNPGNAIAVARSMAKEYARRETDYREESYVSYLFYASYSCEGDYVAVFERKLQ